MSYGQHPTSKLLLAGNIFLVPFTGKKHIWGQPALAAVIKEGKREQCLKGNVFFSFLPPPPFFFFLPFGTKAKRISAGSSVEGAHSWTNTLPFTARSVSHSERTAAHGAVSWATFLRPRVCSLLVAALQVVPTHSALCLNLSKILLECTTSVWSYLPQARIGHHHQPLAS